jgi:uncharacterized protein (TIGR00255 family)
MIHSMTGFGNARFRVGDWTFELEMRSVNHRHFDARIRLPRLLASLEPDVRARLANRLARGKIDLTVNAPEGGAPAPRLEVDLAAAREYLAAGRALAQSDGVPGELERSRCSRCPVYRASSTGIAVVCARRTLTLSTWARALFAMRANEGAALARDLRGLDRVGELAGEISSGVVRSVRGRLRSARQLEGKATRRGARCTGVAIAADRMDITERSAATSINLRC